MGKNKLKKCDEIIFCIDKYPRDGKRYITFYKKTVEFVENVEELSEKITAINMLASGKKIEDVAKELSLNINTIYRWKKIYKFKVVLR